MKVASKRMILGKLLGQGISLQALATLKIPTIIVSLIMINDAVELDYALAWTSFL